MSNATNRYETQLRIAAYRAITDLLANNSLIDKVEERKIRKYISKMQDDLISPENHQKHDRDLSTI